MQSKYDLYKPELKIRDVYSAEKSYYRSPDVTLSPQMTVGSLSSQNKRGEDVLLSENFKLGKTAAKSQSKPVVIRPFTAPAITATHKLRQTKPVIIRGGLASITTTPKKYSAERGVYTTLTGKVTTITKLAAPILGAISIVVLLALLGSEQAPVKPTGTKPATQKPTTISVENTSSQSTPAADTSGDTSPSTTSSRSRSSQTSPAASSVSSENTNSTPAETGGMGAGETTPVVDTPVDTPPIDNPLDPIISPVIDPDLPVTNVIDTLVN